MSAGGTGCPQHRPGTPVVASCPDDTAIRTKCEEQRSPATRHPHRSSNIRADGEPRLDYTSSRGILVTKPVIRSTSRSCSIANSGRLSRVNILRGVSLSPRTR